MDSDRLQAVIEAILFTLGSQVEIKKLAEVTEAAEEEVLSAADRLEEKYKMVPDVTGLSVKEGSKLLRGFNIKYSGSGDNIYKQMPKGNSMTKENGTIMIYLN